MSVTVSIMPGSCNQTRENKIHPIKRLFIAFGKEEGVKALSDDNKGLPYFEAAQSNKHGLSLGREDLNAKKNEVQDDKQSCRTKESDRDEGGNPSDNEISYASKPLVDIVNKTGIEKVSGTVFKLQLSNQNAGNHVVDVNDKFTRAARYLRNEASRHRSFIGFLQYQFMTLMKIVTVLPAGVKFAKWALGEDRTTRRLYTIENMARSIGNAARTAGISQCQNGYDQYFMKNECLLLHKFVNQQKQLCTITLYREGIISLNIMSQSGDSIESTDPLIQIANFNQFHNMLSVFDRICEYSVRSGTIFFGGRDKVDLDEDVSRVHKYYDKTVKKRQDEVREEEQRLFAEQQLAAARRSQSSWGSFIPNNPFKFFGASTIPEYTDTELTLLKPTQQD